MLNLAVIGAGISGLAVANELKNRYNVTVFEGESSPGGLIRCKNVQGNLFHMCGGHVFNSKRTDVLDWFWQRFSKDDFIKKQRNSTVVMSDGQYVPYPIENHCYYFDQEIQRAFIKDLLSLNQNHSLSSDNFEDFLKNQFGSTLYNLYFKPYNEKVWRCDLKEVPLSWLEGKLPMPSVEEMILNNMNHIEEKSFVHSSFWYEKKGGSQYIADTLAKKINVRYNSKVDSLQYENKKWSILGEEFDYVIFCGNIKDMIKIVKGVDLSSFYIPIDKLKYHGTTSVFCEIDSNPYTWIYQPSPFHKSHRIICTGNFSPSNNFQSIATGTVEFTDSISREEIIENLRKMPMHPKYLDHNFSEFTYPIQDNSTRSMISEIKRVLSQFNFFFSGRFADWEYYNMDVAIGAAIDLCKKI